MDFPNNLFKKKFIHIFLNGFFLSFTMNFPGAGNVTDFWVDFSSSFLTAFSIVYSTFQRFLTKKSTENKINK